MARSTVFDLASVTKVMATTMALMLLVDRDPDLGELQQRVVETVLGVHR
jgi:hypothetical protein